MPAFRQRFGSSVQDRGTYRLRERIKPLLPPWPRRSPGSRPVPDRLCRQGILFVMHHDIAWQQLPLVWGFGSGQTCWRRLDRW
ncbi:transposase [Streptomyces microflavus]|uniref:transposase n=1 Tax=Streptomyces microflavus TaxID=1919 RepID=UPI00340C2A86